MHPARIALRLYPEEFRSDDALVSDVLRAFAETVVPVPGAELDRAAASLTDPAFPLATHAGYLASDLCRRASALGATRFDHLEAAQRHDTAEAALADGGITSRLEA